MRLFHILARALIMAAVGVLLLCGAVIWRTAQGPVSLAPVQPVLEWLIHRSSPNQVAFREPSLAWDRDAGTLRLQVADLEVRDRAGEFIASAPMVTAAVAVGPLFEGQLQPVAIDLALPELQLTREQDQTMVLSFAGNLTSLPLTTGGDGEQAVTALSGGGSGDPGLASLRELRVRAPALVFVDVATGQQAAASDAVFALRQGEAGWEGSLGFKLEDGTASFRLLPADAPGLQPVVVELERFPVQALGALLPNLPVGEVVVPLSGEVRFAVDTATRALGAATIDVRTREATLDASRYGLQALPVREAVLQARLEPGWQAATIDRLSLESAAFGLDLSGSLGWGARPRAELSLAARELDVADILGLWPVDLAAAGRDWVAKNVARGRIGAASLHLGGAAPRPGQSDLGAGFAFEEAEVRYLDGFPPATGVAGEARFAGSSLAVTLARGSVGEVRLERGEVVLRELDRDGRERLTAEVRLRSPVAAAMRVLDSPPLRLSGKIGLAPSAFSGEQSTSASLSLRLGTGALTYKAATSLSNIAVRGVRPGYDVAAERAQLDVTQDGLDLTSALKVNGVPLDVALRENFEPRAGEARRIGVKGRLDSRAAKALKFDWPSPVAGQVAVEATIVEGTKPLRRVDLVADLKRAAVLMPELIIDKRAGKDGDFELSLVQPSAARAEVERFRLVMPNVVVRGSAGASLEPFAADRLLVNLLRWPLGQASADLTRKAGVWNGRIDAPSLDLRPLLRSTRGGSGGGGTIPDLALDVKVARLRLGEAPIDDLLARVERRRGVWEAARLRSQIERTPVDLDFRSHAGNGALSLRADDAGWLFRAFASGPTGVAGGRLRLHADLAQTPRLAGTGELKIHGFTLVGSRAPTVARIVSLASFSGLANALTGRGIPIDRMTVPFQLDGQRLELRQARLVGAQIGMRADGPVDFARGTVNVTGTVAPAYTVNRILGRIPIIGNIMRGERADAALAATFSVTGNLASPSISVNPLAALVPGMVRDLFNTFSADDGSSETRIDAR